MKKCLVADNNMFYLEFFKDVLTSYGYEVKAVYDGIAALEAARIEKFDLFLLDYVMPKVDGIRLAKYLREFDLYKDTPIILITAAALESVTMSENEHLIDVFIAKAPFDKMKQIFSEIIPNIDSFKKDHNKTVFGLENIYPRQIVKELLVIELNYSMIFQNLIEGILELDDNGVAVFANNSFCKIMSKREHEIVGLPIEIILDFKTNPDLKDAFESLKNHTSTHRENVVVNIGDKTVHFSFYNIIVKENRKQGYFVVLQDITNIRNKVLQISALFNITQAFLMNLEYKNVLQYVIFELRRLIGATNVSLLFACNGIFKGEKLMAFDRKSKETEKKKIEFWINKIEEWKKSGLVNIKSFSKLNKIKFDNHPILMLPLAFKETFLGTLIGFKNTNDDFEDEEVKFFEAVGNQLSVYMANEELLAAANKKSLFLENEADSSTTTEDAIFKISFSKWQEKNKKNLIKNIVERLNTSLSTINGCVEVLDKSGVFEQNDLKKVCNNISCSYNNLVNLKEELSVLNKIGIQEESEFHVFSVEMLLKRVANDIAFADIDFPDTYPNIQRIGDFEKISFFFKQLLLELIQKGAKSIKIYFVEDSQANCLSISFSLPIDVSVQGLLNEGWQDIVENLYYVYWELKSSLEILNAKVTCSLVEERYKIDIIFPNSREGERNEKI